MRVALMGTGSLGTIMGAMTSKNGGDMILIDAYEDHVKALNEKGAQVVGSFFEGVYPVTAITPDQMDGIYDLVILLCKQTANEVALNQLLPHLGPDSIVCTLQNGVPEDSVAAIVGADRVMGATVGWGATFKGPGVSELTSPVDKMTYELGELDSSIRERTQKVAEFLNFSGVTDVVPNILGIRWTKLLINATMSGMSALTGGTYGDVLDNEKALMCAAHIGKETLDVVKARGIKLEPIQGNNLEILYFSNEKERAAKMPIYKLIFNPHRALKASMLQDLEKGRKTEVDAIVGVVSEWGKKAGVPTPVSDQVVKIIKEIEDGKRTYSFDNLNDITIPEIPKE